MLYNEKIYYKQLLDCKTKDVRDIMCQKLNDIRGMSAETILQKYNPTNAIPVNLDKILEEMGIFKFPASFDDIERIENNGKISGLVLLHGDDIGIFYREEDSIEEKRFTIAHELAHCCMHEEMLKNGYVEFLHDEGFEGEHEAGASFFAMKLLIPEKQLKDIHTKLLLPSLEGLANIFEVPKHIMKHRLVDLRMAYYLDDENKMVKPAL